MNSNEEEEIKKEFQLERVVLFSDAVFAIIITIMVLELKLPENIHHASADKISNAFIELIPKFLAYVISFFLIGNFWLRHLRIFSFLKDYDKGLIIFNLAFLFFISLFPFAASMISSSVKMMRNSWGFSLYIGIIAMMIIAQTMLIHYLIANKQKLCIKTNEIENILEWKVQKLNYILMPCIFALITLINCLGLNIQFVVYGFAFYGVVTGRLRKKYYPENVRSNTPLIAQLFKKLKNRRTPIKQVTSESTDQPNDR